MGHLIILIRQFEVQRNLVGHAPPRLAVVVCLILDRLGGKGKAETPLVILFVRFLAASERYSAVRGATAPAPATQHTVRLRIPIMDRIALRTAAILIPSIAAPLPYIAAHVIDAQLVRQLAFHVAGPSVVAGYLVPIPVIIRTAKEPVAGVLPIPRHIVNIVVPSIIGAASATASFGSILPFRLGRQTETHTP